MLSIILSAKLCLRSAPERVQFFFRDLPSLSLKINPDFHRQLVDQIPIQAQKPCESQSSVRVTLVGRATILRGSAVKRNGIMETQSIKSEIKALQARFAALRGYL